MTSARIALGHVGGSLPTAAQLDFQLAHARARDAVHRALDVVAVVADLAQAGLSAVPVESGATHRTEYLQRPDLGRRLGAASRARLLQAVADSQGPTDPRPDASFLIADGLSALAAERHAVPLLRALLPRLQAEAWRVSPIVVAREGRVALGDEVGATFGARLVVVLIGERPGLSSPDSLGIYLTYGPAIGRKDSERNCISNVRGDGLGYEIAAARLCFLMSEARRRKLSGTALKDDSAGFLTGE